MASGWESVFWAPSHAPTKLDENEKLLLEDSAELRTREDKIFVHLWPSFSRWVAVSIWQLL